MKHYSIWSNYIFTFKPLWQQKRRIALCFLAATVLFVAVPVVGMMITSMMIGSLEQGISMQRFVCRALLAFAGYGVLSMAKSYLDARNDGQYIEARTPLFLMDWIKKDLTVSMEQCEDAQIQKLKKKSENCIWANEWGIEGFMRHNLDLLKSLLGLFVYTLIVGIMNWKILAMLVGMSAVSAAAAYGVTRYYEKIKDPLAEQGVTMGYINREVDDVQSGKDIRIFGLGKWIVGKYDQAIKKCRRLYFQRDIREYGSNMLDTALDAVRDLVCYLYLILQLSQGMRISEFVFYLGLVAGFSNWIGMISKRVVSVKQESDNISELRNYLLLEEEAPSGGKLAETEIYQKYQTLMQGKSVLFISHRLASTRFCDRILLLAEGRIQEQGTHEELMQEQGAYYQLFQVQSKYYDKAEDGYE